MHRYIDRGLACRGSADPWGDALEVLGSAVDVLGSHLGKGLAEIAVLLIELAVTLPVHFQEPEDVLPNIGDSMASRLALLGVGSCELFCAAGIDTEIAGCQLRLSSLFKSQDQARNAAIAMERKKWVVARWRTDASASFDLVDSSGL
jgi:hypothetical protein